MSLKQAINSWGLRCSRPFGGEPRPSSGPYSPLKVALIADDFTRIALSYECAVRSVTPQNYLALLRVWKPDLLVVESTWNGLGRSWRYKIASYPDRPERNNHALVRVVAAARDCRIPTVFWNREDSVHFERFIASAQLFDHIFTVDETCLDSYRERIPSGKTFGVLMFAVQPRIHFPNGAEATEQRAAFLGSYNCQIHPRRLERQRMLFGACKALGLTVYDRNSTRKGTHYRYPNCPWIEVKPGIPHEQTANVYRRYGVLLNVNTIEDSPTMFSRRLLEILACAGVVATTPALAVERWFGAYCQVFGESGEAEEFFARIGREGVPVRVREQARAGAEHVKAHWRWDQWLERLLEQVA